MIVVAVGVGVAGVQLLPLWELSTFSFRGHSVPYDFATAFAPPPQNLLTLLFPYFFRDPGGTYRSPFFHDASGAYWSPWFRWDTTAYGGIVPLVLALVAVVLAIAPAVVGRRAAVSPPKSRPRSDERAGDVPPLVPTRWVVFFGGVLIVGLLLALGDASPLNLYALLWRLPGFWSTRVPARYLFFVLFALAILAGFGLDGLARLLADRAPAVGRHRQLEGSRVWLRCLRWLLMALTAFGLATLAAFWFVRGWAAANPETATAALLKPYLALRGRGLEIPTVQDPFAAFLASLDPLSRWTERSFLILGLALLLLWAWSLVRRPGAVFRLGLILLTAGDLVLFARDFHPRVPIDQTIANGPAIRFLVEHNGLHRVASMWPVWETWPNKLLAWKIAEASGYSSLLPDRHSAYLAEANRLDNRLFDVMGVKYLVVHRSRIPGRLQAERAVFEDAEVAIYERRTVLPRALVVAGATLATSRAESLRWMTRADFDPLDELVVEDPAALAWAAAVPGLALAGHAEIASYAAEHVQIRARVDRPSFLFLSDRYYPGWRAFVDGEERPIYRADVLFRAVPLPPGEHTVTFVFDPVSIKIGAVLSMLTLLAGGLGLAATVPGIRRSLWRSPRAPS